jgi:hypothetical protein
MQVDPGQERDLYTTLAAESEVRALIEHLDEMLESFFEAYSAPQYDLWDRGVSKGIPSRPDQWLHSRPWAWIKKYWRDYVWSPEPPKPFASQP